MTDVGPIDPSEDDLSRTYLQRREQTADDDIINRARQSIERPLAGSPEDAPLPEEEPEEGATIQDVGLDVTRGAVETPRAVVTGLAGAAIEFSENMDQIGQALGKSVFGESKGTPKSFLEMTPAQTMDFARLLSAATRKMILEATPDDPESTTGQAIQGITQFVAGFIPAVRASRVLGISRGGERVAGAAGKAVGRFTEASVAGSLADVAVIDEQDERLSNLIQEFPELQNPVTEFLASDPDDSVAENKLKQALEGLGLGAAADAFVSTVRFLSKAKRVRSAGEEQVREAEVEQRPAATEEDFSSLATAEKPVIKIDAKTKKAAAAFLKGEPGVTLPPRGTARREAGDTDLLVGNINIARMGGPDDVREAVARTAKLFENKVTGDIQGNDQTIALANEIAADPERMTEVLMRGRGKGFSAAEVTALRFMVQQSSNDLRVLGQKVSAGTASEVEQFTFLRQMAFHASLLGQASSAARESGRALQAFQIPAKGAEEQRQFIERFLQQSGGDTQQMAAMVAALDTPEGLNTFVRQSQRASASDVLLEAWINGLLSGPQTHVVNMTSNSLVALWQVPERLLARGIRDLTGGDGVAAQEVTGLLYGLTRGSVDGLRMAGRALRSGESTDILTKIEARRQEAISSTSLGIENMGPISHGVDLLGEVVRLPGRFLTAEDEFFKAVGYRMELNSRAFRTAASEGLEGEAMARRVQQIMNDPPEDLRLAAIDASRINTFTNPLNEGGRSFQRAISKLPAARVIMPFIRTPVNIMKFVGMRSPLAPLAKSFRADLMAGGARRDLALARMGLGSMVMAAAADMSMSGILSGGGPTDARLRSALRRTGWQPYSIRVGDQWVSYNRLDPIGATLGIGADLAEILGQAERVDGEAAAAAAVMAVSQNIVSKTYMSGIADVMEVFASVSPELGASRGEEWLKRLGGSVVPAGAAQLTRVLDPTLRQTQGIVDQIRSRVPGYSEDLPPRLNLWGDPILLTGGVGPDIMSPLWTSPVRQSPVDDEIVANGAGIRMPGRVIGDVELTPEQYNRYVELAGNELKDPSTGLGARETLEAIIAGKHSLSSEYQSAQPGPDGGKALIIGEVVTKFRQAARAKMIEEDAELRNAVETRIKERAKALEPQ